MTETRKWILAAALGCMISASMFELIPGLGLGQSWTVTWTTSPRPTPFIRRSGQRNVAHQISFRFQMKDGTIIDWPWEKFREWRQTFPLPHHALLVFYRPTMSGAIINPTVLKTVITRFFCTDNPIRDHFKLPGEPAQVHYRMGLETDVDRVELEVLCSR